MSEAMIHVLALAVEIRDRRILDGVSLQAAHGETVAVVGPNGAGKTTLLRALAGLISATGELAIAGYDPRLIADALRPKILSYCPQKPTAAWNYRVRDLGEISGQPAAFATWLEKLNLPHFAERRLAELSGGEQKAVHLAMTFAGLTEPYGRALLLDEPSASLDRTRQATVRQAVAEFAHAGAACVIATHDLGFARQCDTVVVLADGCLRATGSPTAALTPALCAEVWGEGLSAEG